MRWLWGVAVLLLLTAVPPTAAAVPREATAAVSGSLQIGPFVAHPYHGFWAVVLNGGHLLNSTLAAEFNATPFVLIRYGADIDETNISNDCTYTSSGVCQPADMDYPAFKTFCRWVHCKAILGVPAETDDPGLAAETVRYVEKTVGFTPAYWSIGNEPEGWTHFDIPFSQWRPSDRSTPTAQEFGQETVAMTAAIHSVDPKARVIGDQDAQEGSAHSFLNNVSRDDGANLSALAFHSYPGRDGPMVPRVAEFISPYNVTRTSSDYRGDLSAIDRGCACSLPLMVGEFNGGFGGSLSNYLRGYADVPMTAAVAAEMLSDGAASFGFFSFTGSQPFDLVNSSTLAGSPTYRLYAGLLAYLPMGSTYAVNLTTTLAGVYAVEEVDNRSHSGVLVVNTNTTTALNLSLLSLRFPLLGGSVVTDTRSNGLSNQTYPALTGPTHLLVAPEEVALLLPGLTVGLAGLTPFDKVGNATSVPSEPGLGGIVHAARGPGVLGPAPGVELSRGGSDRTELLLGLAGAAGLLVAAGVRSWRPRRARPANALGRPRARRIAAARRTDAFRKPLDAPGRER